MFQRILGFIASNPWLIIIVLGGLFNVAVRLQQKTREQRAKREAANAIARRRAEALRTGKQVDEPVIVFDDKPQQSQEEQRRARIEALRQQRMQQLQALREKRAGTSTGGIAAPARPAPGSTARPTLPTQRVTAPARTSQPSRTSRTQPPRTQPQQTRRPNPQPTQRPTRTAQPQRPRVIAPSPSSRPPTKPQAQPQSKPRTPAPAQASAMSARSSDSRAKLIGAPKRVSETPSIGSMLRSRSQVRQAMVLREILDAPVALRDPDQGPGAMAP